MYTFLVIIIVLLLPIPLYILYKKKFAKTKERNKALELKRSFNELLETYRLSIDEVEIFNSKIIGLDKKNGNLIWIEYVGNTLQQRCISLNELESHRVTKILDIIEGCFSEVVLELFPKDQKPVSFTFYDRSRDDASEFSYLLDKAKYWDASINFHVNANNSGNAFEFVL